MKLGARIAPLLPKNIAALFEGETLLTGDVALTDAGATAVQALGVETKAFALKASGTLDSAGGVDLRAALHGREGGDGAAFRAKTLEGEAHVTGRRDNAGRPAAPPRRRGAVDAGRFDHVDLEVKAKATAR